MGLPINRSAGAIAGVSLLGLLLSISLIACSSTKEHAMEENELPATSSIDQAESLPIGDNGQTTTVELYGINVPIGEDWHNDGDRGTDGLWYASGYSSNAQVCVQENSMDNMPIEECELSLEEFCDGILAEYTNPEVNISQNICSIQGISCRIASASNANINGDLYNLCILVLPSENKIVSLFYAIDAATGTEGCWYLESLARQTTYTKDELTIIQNAMQERREEEEAKAKTEAEEKAAREALANATHPAGTYKVGEDIPAGEYKLESSGKGGYYCVYPDTSKSEILENDNFSSVNYINLEDGQCIELSRCSMVEIAYATPTSTPSGDGMYKIGFDIPAGEYKLSATDDRGYYCIYDNSSVTRDIQENDNFEGTTYCTVSNSQYLVVSRAEIIL